jgi:hypothetical protein
MGVNMRRKGLALLSVAFIISFLVLVLGGCGDSSPGLIGKQQGKTELPKDKDGKSQEAPAFSLPQLGSEEEINFPLDFQGQKTLLLFFSLG